MKQLLSGLLLCSSSLIFAQTLKNWQFPVYQFQANGSTSSDPSTYNFQEADPLQRVDLYLPPTTVNRPEVYLQSGNCAIYFDVYGYNQYTSMTSLWIQWDNDALITLFDGENIGSYRYDPPALTGVHNLKVLFRDKGGNDLIERNYTIIFIEKCSAYYQVDNGNPDFSNFSNKITVWEKNDGVDEKLPILVVEGFNPASTLNSEYYRHVLGEVVQKGYNSEQRFYFLDFGINGQDMRINAAVLYAAIKFVSELNRGKNIVVAGLNMGGVIARYCLAKNEQDNKGFGLNNYLPVQTFLSIEAPQQGMVISQELLAYLHSHQEEEPHYEMNTPAAKQLIRGNNPFGGNTHRDFFRELNAINETGYPSFCDNIGFTKSRSDLKNPHVGLKWFKINVTFLSDNDFEDFINDEEALPGSLLPPSIGRQDDMLIKDKAINVYAKTERLADPTFIPYTSALDIVDSVSKFCAVFETNSKTALFSDNLPSSMAEDINLILKNDSLVAIPVTKVYNYASGVVGLITQDLTVVGKMFINGNSPAGFSDNPAGPAPMSNSSFRVSTSCKVSKIEVKPNTEMRIGDKSIGTDGHLNLTYGELIIGANSVLIIDDSSRVIIGKNAKLTLLPLSKVVVKKGAYLTIQGILDESVLSNIEILGGTVNLGGTNVISMTPDFGLTISDNGTFIMEEKTELNYAVGSEIKLNGENSLLEIGGKINLAAGANFTFSADAGQNLGVLRLNPHGLMPAPIDQQKFIVAGTGSSITIPAGGKLEIANTLYLPYQLKTFNAQNTQIEIGTGKFLHIDSYDLNLSQTQVNGSGTIQIFPRKEGATHTINGSTFNQTTLSDFNSSINPAKFVITGCTFKNGAKVIENRSGLEISGCVFEDNSSILISHAYASNKIENCVFTGTTNVNTIQNAQAPAAIRMNDSRVISSVTQNGIMGYYRGLALGSLVDANLACNLVTDNYNGIQLGVNAKAVFQNGSSSSNSIVDQAGTNFLFTYGNVPQTPVGGNEFYNNAGLIFKGTVNNYFCKPSVPNNITVAGNCWKTGDCNTQYWLNNQSKSELNGFSNITCTSCKLTVSDNTPQPKAPCVLLRQPNGIPLIPELVKCPACPLLFTQDFNGVNLAAAVKRAEALTTLADPDGINKTALSLFRQILTYPYVVKNQTTYLWLMNAYTGAKYAATEMVVNGEKDIAAIDMYAIYEKFKPVEYSGHTEMDVYLLELDKADILNTIGRTDEALNILIPLHTSVDEPLASQVSMKIALYQNDKAYVSGSISADLYIDRINNLATPPDDPTFECFQMLQYNPSVIHESGIVEPGFSTGSESKNNLFQALSIEGLPIEGQLIEVYPIPSGGLLNIDFGTKAVEQVIVTNLLGKIVYTGAVKDVNTTTLDLSGLPKGIYILQCFITGQDVHSQKITLH